MTVTEAIKTHGAAADLVLYACGSRPNALEAEELQNAVPQFVITGDAKRARTVKEAPYG